MKPNAFPILALVSVLQCLGCRTLTPPARGEQLTKSTHWLNYDATRRAGFIFTGDTQERVLSEPAPDVALESVTSLMAKVKGNEMTAEVQEGIVELGKRTASVMILREALYRLGEMTINGTLDAQSEALYGQIIDAVKIIAIAEAADAVAELQPEDRQAVLDSFNNL
jgi:hypothetical protein